MNISNSISAHTQLIKLLSNTIFIREVRDSQVFYYGQNIILLEKPEIELTALSLCHPFSLITQRQRWHGREAGGAGGAKEKPDAVWVLKLYWQNFIEILKLNGIVNFRFDIRRRKDEQIWFFISFDRVLRVARANIHQYCARQHSPCIGILTSDWQTNEIARYKKSIRSISKF